MATKTEVLQEVVIKFAGDSGDGMQLTGSQFTNNTALWASIQPLSPISLPKYVHRRAHYRE